MATFRYPLQAETWRSHGNVGAMATLAMAACTHKAAIYSRIANVAVTVGIMYSPGAYVIPANASL